MKALSEIGKRLAKLIDVKSLISLSLTFIFCKLALKEYISSEIFISVYSIIIGFYFGTQYQKSKNETDIKEEK